MTGKLLFNADSGIDLTSIPRTKSAISFNNAGSNRIGINFTDGDGNLRIAKTDINQDWVSGDVNILLGSNNYKVWHAGNDGSGSGLMRICWTANIYIKDNGIQYVTSEETAYWKQESIWISMKSKVRVVTFLAE